MTAARNVLSKRQTRGRSRIREQLQNARQRLLPLSPEQNELRRVSIRVRKVREKPLRRESPEPGETVRGTRLHHLTLVPGVRGEDSAGFGIRRYPRRVTPKPQGKHREAGG